MLVANPGQAPYSIISTKSCSNKATRNNATVSSSSRCIPPSSATTASSTSTVVSNTMTAVTAIPTNNQLNSLKTLSVRITREADLFKNTVQKTLPSRVPTHNISAFSLYTVPPTSIHRYPERIETLSTDSLKSEMCHFKPIRTVPTTPAKRSKTGTIKIPVAVKEEPADRENKRPNQSINLMETIDYSRPRVSAFCLITITSNSNQQNKVDKSCQASAKKGGQTMDICTVTTTSDNIISSVNFKGHKELISSTSVKHRTRNSKTLTSILVVEQLNNKTKPQRETRVTRKRQQQIEKSETIEKKVKLSKDCSKSLKNEKKNSNTGRFQPNRRTPPVTRSRLKLGMIHTRKQYQNK